MDAGTLVDVEVIERFQCRCYGTRRRATGLPPLTRATVMDRVAMIADADVFHVDGGWAVTENRSLVAPVDRKYVCPKCSTTHVTLQIGALLDSPDRDLRAGAYDALREAFPFSGARGTALPPPTITRHAVIKTLPGHVGGPHVVYAVAVNDASTTHLRHTTFNPDHHSRLVRAVSLAGPDALHILLGGGVENWVEALDAFDDAFADPS